MNLRLRSYVGVDEIRVSYYLDYHSFICGKINLRKVWICFVGILVGDKEEVQRGNLDQPSMHEV